MKKTLILTAVLLLCLTMLASCSDLVHSMNADSASDSLDELERAYKAQGYTLDRYEQSEVTAFAESLVASEGIVLKAGLAGVIEFSGVNSDTGNYVMGITIGTSANADAKALAELYRGYSDEAGEVTVEVRQQGLIVEVFYTK